LWLASLLCTLAFSPRASASTETLLLPNPGPGTLELGGRWQFKTGDDSAWAAPGFDDSAWESIAVDQPWGAQDGVEGSISLTAPALA
jgi:hypothetical protein